MGRSKISRSQKCGTMVRLRREGRWGLAWEYREKLRTQEDFLSADESWLAMEKEFPPQKSPGPAAEPSDPSGERD